MLFKNKPLRYSIWTLISREIHMTSITVNFIENFKLELSGWTLHLMRYLDHCNKQMGWTSSFNIVHHFLKLMIKISGKPHKGLFSSNNYTLILFVPVFIWNRKQKLIFSKHFWQEMWNSKNHFQSRKSISQ